MTTPLEPLGDVPFLPRLPAAAPPLALQPQLPNGNDFVAYLPPVRRPEPVPEQPIAFDARAMVEATKRRVDSPAYGHMPAGTEEGRAAAEAARAAMKRKRARNKLIGRAVVLVALGGLGAAGWFGYQAYQDDQDRQAAERAAKSEQASLANELADDRPAAVSPLGEQVEVIGATDQLNSGATPSAGGLLDAVQDARDVVGATAAGELREMAYTLDAVMPAEVSDIAIALDATDDFDQFQIPIAMFRDRSPEIYTEWVARWSDVQQVGSTDPAFGVLAPVVDGQISLAFAVDGERVTRLLIVSPELGIHVVAGG